MSKRRHLRGVLAMAAGFVLAACGLEGPMRPDRGADTGGGPAGTAPQRIVSLDYCADQYVLKFAEPGQIRAVSPDAAAPYSYMRDTARGLPRVRPVAEDVLAMKPDLIVRSYGGGPRATTLFERAGIPVLEVGWTSNLDDVASNTQRLAAALGAPEEGERLAAHLRDRLEAVEDASPPGPAPSVLYMTPGGVTSGPGSLVHEVLETAGLKNFQNEPGWRSLPLERLAREQPDLVARAEFNRGKGDLHRWSAARHPIARQQIETRPTVSFPGAWTACGGWFLADAVEALAEEAARQAASPGRMGPSVSP